MSEQRKSTMERAAHYTFGPRFFTEGDGVMFEFVIDSGNKVGPRPATDADKEKHAAAWAEFNGVEAPAAPEPAPPAVARRGNARRG